MSEAPTPIKVLLADDSAPFREMLRLLLNLDPRFVVVGEAHDGVEAVELTTEHRPDVILLDVAMPRMDGFQALEAIRESVPALKVVMLSAFGAGEVHAKAAGLGAHAYVEKGAPLREITETILRVHEGG